MKELWKNIEGYEGRYQVSTEGKIKSFARYKIGKLVYLKEDKNGYYNVQLHKTKIRKWFRVGRLVAKAFISNPDNKSQVNHKDGVKKKDEVENLEWVTCSENVQHSFDKLSHKRRPGLLNHSAKLIERDVLEIRKSELSQSKLALKFSISQSQISKIKTNKRWKHIK